MTKPLGVAIIGCGAIGVTHLGAVLETAGLTVTALVDPVIEAAERLADAAVRRGVDRPSTYLTLDEVLSDERINVVALATPSGIHIRDALRVLAAQKHVIIEKPLDVNTRNIGAIVDAADQAAQKGIVASVISQHRFDQASEFVAGKIASGKLGQITSAIATVSWWRSQGYYDSGDWRGTWAMDGGGALMNQGVHTLDLLLRFLGVPVSVSAQTALLDHSGIEVEDTVVATLTFESGALAMFHATTAAYPSLAARVQVMASKGSAVIERDAIVYFHEADPGEDIGFFGLGEEGNQLDRFPHQDEKHGDATASITGHVRQYRDIVGAITDGRAPGVTVRDAAIVLATARAIYLSGTIGESVRVADVMSGWGDDIEVVVGGNGFERANNRSGNS